MAFRALDSFKPDRIMWGDNIEQRLVRDTLGKSRWSEYQASVYNVRFLEAARRRFAGTKLRLITRSNSRENIVLARVVDRSDRSATVGSQPKRTKSGKRNEATGAYAG